MFVGDKVGTCLSDRQSDRQARTMKVCAAGVEAYRSRVQNPGDPCVHRDDDNNLLVKVEAI
jgi:hypothetical protein